MTKKLMRWRVEHRSKYGFTQNYLEAPKMAVLEEELAHCIMYEWVLTDGDTIHIIRQTED